MTLDSSMLARMKLVLVQSLGVVRMVMSVNPLPHTLITAQTRRSVALTIIGDASDTGALPVCSAVVASTLLLMLASGDSDVIVTSLHSRAQPVFENTYFTVFRISKT